VLYGSVDLSTPTRPSLYLEILVNKKNANVLYGSVDLSTPTRPWLYLEILVNKKNANVLYGSVDLSTPTCPSLYLACSLVWLGALAIVSVASTLILAILVFVDTVWNTLI
jgi:hypothetical protein